MKIPSLATLVKIAGFTGIAVGGTGYAFRFKVQNDVYKSDVYKDTLQFFYNHKKGVELLGAPVKEGRVNVSDHEAIGNNNNIGWLTIPLHGSRRKGELRAELLMNPKSTELKKYNIYKIELKVNDMPNKVFVLKDESGSVQGVI